MYLSAVHGMLDAMSLEDTQQLPVNRTQELPRTTAVRHTRRIVVSIVGGALVAGGLVLIPLPGPFTIPLLFLGLTVLSWEFRWARRLLVRARAKVQELRARGLRARR